MSTHCKHLFAHNVVAIGINCAFRRGDQREIVSKCDRFITDLTTCCGTFRAVSFLRAHGMESLAADRLVTETIDRLALPVQRLAAV